MTESEPITGFDLEQFRRARGLTYDALGEFIGAVAKTTARTWAVGQVWPDADRVEQIIERTEGAVTLEAMHRRRLQWLRENKASVQPNSDADADAEGDESE